MKSTQLKDPLKALLRQKWDIPVGRAKQIQMELAEQVDHRGQITTMNDVKTVAGADIGYDGRDRAHVALVVCSFPGMKLLEKVCFRKKYTNIMPYIPGYLSFREAPPVIQAFAKLNQKPDVLLVDGQGIAHPRRCGLATHLGILLGIPSIGCAKSRLYGTCQDPPPGLRGAYTLLKDDQGEIMGIVLRTRQNVKPVFVSIGTGLNLDIAGDIVMACCKKYRIPGPLRIAHNFTQKLKR